MRTALMLNDERLDQERPMFNRLCVGLLAEGIHPVRVVPNDFDRTNEDPEEKRIALLPRIAFPAKVMPWLRGNRVSKLADALERFGVQLIHAAGRDLWPVAIGVAQELERPLVLGVWSLDDAEAAGRFRKIPVSAWLAPSERIGAALRRRVDPGLVSVVRAGVPVSAIAPASPVAEPGQCRFIIGLGEGNELRAWDRFLGGVQRIVDAPGFEDLHVVLEVRGSRGHDIWRRVRDLDLQARVCSLSDAAEHRSLLLSGQGLCLPEPMVALRTIVLEAMARCVPVAAVDTPVLDEFDEETGIAVVGDPDPDSWAAALRRMLEDSEETHRMCRKAWQRIHLHHRSSEYAAGVAEVYHAAVHGDALPFDASLRTRRPDAS